MYKQGNGSPEKKETTMTIKEIMLEINCVRKDLKMAHKAIDDFYCHGLHQGFGPIVQSQVIAACNAKLDELKKELIKLGIPSDKAAALCSDEPSGPVYEACVVFIAAYS